MMRTEFYNKMRIMLGVIFRPFSFGKKKTTKQRQVDKRLLARQIESYSKLVPLRKTINHILLEDRKCLFYHSCV